MKKCAYLLLVLMSMNSCKKECLEIEDDFLFMKSKVKSSIPYQDGQIVHFERAGEVYSFVVDIELDTIKSIRNLCEVCCADTVFKYEEQLRVELFDSIHQFKFVFNPRWIDRTVFLNVYPYTNGQDPNASTSLVYILDTLGNFICNYDSTQNGAIYHDTITIGSTLYHDVAELRHNYAWALDTRQVYYSQQKGILKVTFHYDVLDELILIE